MSRTDKDRPLWVRSADPTLVRRPVHRHDAFWVNGRGRSSVPCTIDVAPAANGGVLPCFFEVVDEFHRCACCGARPVTRVATSGPRQRAVLRRLAGQFNARGDVDADDAAQVWDYLDTHSRYC